MRKHTHDTATLLYGLPDAEALYATPALALKAADLIPPGPHVLEVWSTVPAVAHFPEPERITEWLAEHAGEMGEVDEWWYEQAADAAVMPTVLDAAEALVAEMASMVNRRMAHTIVDRLDITYTPSGAVLVDGVPLGLVEALSEPEVAARRTVGEWMAAHERLVVRLLAAAGIAVLGLAAIGG